MSTSHGGLGRGLSALIPTQNEREAGAGEPGSADGRGTEGPRPSGVSGGLLEIPLERIKPNPRQPRREFDETELQNLADSIREVGVLQPIVVRAVAVDSYELIMGERRWRASRLAGRDTVTAVVRGTQDEQLLRDALLENIHRSDLNPLEEAAAYEALLSDLGVTHEVLGERLGVSRAHVSNTMRLLGLPATVQRRVAARVLSAGHARALLALRTVEQMDELATRIVSEGLSVRATEEQVALALADSDEAPARRKRSSGPPPEDFTGVAEQLSDRFDTRVKVEMGRRKGRIVMEFASKEDLERILTELGSPGGS